MSLVSLVVLALCLQASGAAQTQPGAVGVIVTHTGEQHRVTDLRAEYASVRLYGDWSATLFFEAAEVYLGITTEPGKRNELVIPFSEIRKITYPFRPTRKQEEVVLGGKSKGDWNKRGPELLIERRDGSSVAITYRDPTTPKYYLVYEEYGTDGTLTKSVKLHAWETGTFKQVGKAGDLAVVKNYYLGAFVCKTVTPLGAETAFRIDAATVRAVRFE